MKVAVTYDEEEMIFQHFGHTERFKLYDIENGEIVSSEVVDTAGTGHEALAEFLAKRGVQTLICGGIGAGAVQALGMAGIQVYGGITGLADYAVEALIRVADWDDGRSGSALRSKAGNIPTRPGKSDKLPSIKSTRFSACPPNTSSQKTATSASIVLRNSALQSLAKFSSKAKVLST